MAKLVNLSLWLALLSFPLLLSAQQGSLTASLDRTQIVVGETVNLIIEMQGTTNSLSPDLSVLQNQFEVLNSSTQTQLNISNGQQQSVSQVRIVLEARQTGDLIIPPITVGNQQTQQLRLSVLPAPEPSGDVDAAPDIFVEVEVNPETPYVQAQITMIVRLMIGVPLNEASLSEPAPENAEIQRLGEDLRYEADRNGRRYQVIERRYAIFPQQSGQLNIAPVQLSGRVGASRGSLFGSRSRGRRITRTSEAVQLTVLPVPTAYTGDHWIPASALQLTEQPLQQSAEYRVGEPLTRTLELTALGLSDIMLPDLESETPLGARVYADKPVGVSGQQDTWIVGQRTIKQAIVPTVSGPLELPEVRLDWWDTANSQQRTAVVPAVTISVLPAVDGNNQPIEPAATDLSPAPGNVPVIQTTRAVDSGMWPYLSAAFAALWLLTLAAWWRGRQGRRQQHRRQQALQEQRSESISAARKACRLACRNNDAAAASAAVIDWARAILGQQAVNNLAQVAASVEDSSLQSAIYDLQSACYGQQQDPWSGESLWALLQHGLAIATQSDKTERNQSILPPLYPEPQ